MRKPAASKFAPDEAGLRAEYFKGGAWADTMLIPKPLAVPLTEHFKMAGLPVGYRMALQGLILLPQEGGAQDYDIHLSITPTRQGEKIVMKIEAMTRG